MNRYKRSDRVSQLIHRALSKIIENEFREKPDGMITVTGVELSNDLKYARVYFSYLGNADKIETVIDSLNNSAGYMRMRIGEEVILRNVPMLKFYYDSSTLNGMRIDKLLEEINKK